MIEIIGMAALMGAFDNDEHKYNQNSASFIPRSIVEHNMIIHLGCDGQVSIEQINND